MFNKAVLTPILRIAVILTGAWLLTRLFLVVLQALASLQPTQSGIILGIARHYATSVLEGSLFLMDWYLAACVLLVLVERSFFLWRERRALDLLSDSWDRAQPQPLGPDEPTIDIAAPKFLLGVFCDQWRAKKIARGLALEGMDRLRKRQERTGNWRDAARLLETDRLINESVMRQRLSRYFLVSGVILLIGVTLGQVEYNFQIGNPNIRQPSDSFAIPILEVLVPAGLVILLVKLQQYRELAFLGQVHAFLNERVVGFLAQPDPLSDLIVHGIGRQTDVLIKRLDALQDGIAQRVWTLEGTLRETSSARVLREFGQSFHDQIAGFNGRVESMLGDLRSKLLETGEYLSATSANLRDYVAQGGVADTAQFARSVNGLNESICAIKSGLDTIGAAANNFDVAARNLAHLPELTVELKRTGQALQQSGERSSTAAARFSDVGRELGGLRTDLTAVIGRNEIANREVKGTLDVVGVEIGNLRGAITTIHVALSGIQQVVGSLQHEIERLTLWGGMNK